MEERVTLTSFGLWLFVGLFGGIGRAGKGIAAIVCLGFWL